MTGKYGTTDHHVSEFVITSSVTIAENTHPSDRPKSIGTFRLWRDLGYAIGAILTGIISDAFNINTAIILIGVLTIISSIIILYRMVPPKITVSH
ncbi:MAG: hypothetical protein NVSMB24_40040 [Mucilaginibacter sp.]